MYKKDRSAKIEKGLNQTSSADSLLHMNEKEAGEAREILRRRLAEKPEIQELLKNHRSKEKTMVLLRKRAKKEPETFSRTIYTSKGNPAG